MLYTPKGVLRFPISKSARMHCKIIHFNYLKVFHEIPDLRLFNVVLQFDWYILFVDSYFESRGNYLATLVAVQVILTL